MTFFDFHVENFSFFFRSPTCTELSVISFTTPIILRLRRHESFTIQNIYISQHKQSRFSSIQQIIFFSLKNFHPTTSSHNLTPFQTKKPSEPIYAEPSKIPQPVASNSNSSSSMHFEEYEGVTFRNPPQASTQLNVTAPQTNRKSETIRSDQSAVTETTGKDEEKNRHSDSQLLKDVDQQPEDSTTRPSRKYHSKSFSLSENRIAAAAGSNLFHQNRELWEKRAELQSQQSLTTSRILSRNRIAPDLVMDLPFPVSKDCPTRSSRDSLDIDAEDLTSAERFAQPNQCTLKKNERFSNESYESSKKEVKLDFKNGDKPKAEVKPQEISMNTADSSDDSPRSSTDRSKLDDVLHIEEEPSKEIHKSPIPARNTKKFVTQFADLHLTGGCLSSSTESPQTGNGPPPGQQTLSSFKPQVKVKPQLMKKPLVLPPTTPEMSRRSHD